jgi:hypothetical protein
MTARSLVILIENLLLSAAIAALRMTARSLVILSAAKDLWRT